MKTWKEFLVEARDEQRYQELLETTLVDLRNQMTPEEIAEYKQLHDEFIKTKMVIAKKTKADTAQEFSPYFRELWFSGKKDQIRSEIDRLKKQTEKDWKN